MPCFSTGTPVMIEAIVGNRSAGLTPVADQVTDPSLISLDIVGIAPPLRESCPNPSRTKRITCSVSGTEGALFPTGGAGCIEAPDEPTSTTMEMPTAIVAIRPNPIVMETPLTAAATKGIWYLSTRIFRKASRPIPVANRLAKGVRGCYAEPIFGVPAVNRRGG